MTAQVPASRVPEGLPGDLATLTLEAMQPGDIILLHGMFRANQGTRDALPEILAGLDAQAFRVVPVGTLLGLS